MLHRGRLKIAIALGELRARENTGEMWLPHFDRRLDGLEKWQHRVSDGVEENGEDEREEDKGEDSRVTLARSFRENGSDLAVCQ